MPAALAAAHRYAGTDSTHSDRACWNTSIECSGAVTCARMCCTSATRSRVEIDSFTIANRYVRSQEPMAPAPNSNNAEHRNRRRGGSCFAMPSTSHATSFGKARLVREVNVMATQAAPSVRFSFGVTNLNRRRSSSVLDF